jgi:hypothetical protein
MKKFIFLTILFLQGCSAPTHPPENFNYLSLLSIQQKIIRDSTSKEEVIQFLGTPNQISINNNGQEVLVWEKRVNQVEFQSGMNSTKDLRYIKETLIAIEFSENGIVKKLSMRASSR